MRQPMITAMIHTHRLLARPSQKKRGPAFKVEDGEGDTGNPDTNYPKKCKKKKYCN